MDIQEILNKIEKLKKAYDSDSDETARAAYSKRIAALQAQIAEEEQKIEKKEEKASTEEKKTINEVEEKIKKLEKALASETDPDTKARYQKAIDKYKGSVQEIKTEIKEEKKEIAEQKKEIKESVEEVKKLIKQVKKGEPVKVRKQPIKKATPVMPKIEEKKKERKKKLKSVISDLDALIEKNKKLKSKYGAAYKKTGKPTDIEKDAKRQAKPFGYRFKGKHDYRVPTEAQIRRGLKRGTIDYEGRPNRADVYVKRKVKLADGGMADGGMMAKGGETEPFSKTGKGKFVSTEDRLNICSQELYNKNYADCTKEERDKSFDLFLKKYAISYSSSSKMAKGGLKVGDKVKVKTGANKGTSGVISNVASDSFGDYTIDVRGHKLYGFKDSDLQKMSDGGEMMKKGGSVPEVKYSEKSGSFYLVDDGKVFQRPINSHELPTKRLLKKIGEEYVQGSTEWSEVDSDRAFNDEELKDFNKEMESLFGVEMMKKGGRTKGSDKKTYSVWVGDGEVNDSLLTKKEAEELAQKWKDDGYDDVVIDNYAEMKRGGKVKKKVGNSKEDKSRFAKPAGWRWKEEALDRKIIKRAQLSMQPSKKMRDKYPDLVYYEDRLNKADKKPTRTSAPSV